VSSITHATATMRKSVQEAEAMPRTAAEGIGAAETTGDPAAAAGDTSALVADSSIE
jgi:hypothetical protein